MKHANMLINVDIGYCGNWQDVYIQNSLLATDLLTCVLFKKLKYLKPSAHKLVSEQK